MTASRRFFLLMFFIAALVLAACQELPAEEGTAGPVAAAPTELPATAETPTQAPAGTETPPTAQAPETGEPEVGDAGENGGGQAYIESVQVNLLESDPVQAQAIVEGNLSDGCTTVEDINVARQEQNFLITVVTKRPADQVCTQALVPFQEAVMLPVAGLAAGTYSVTAGETSTTFTLESDNLAPGGPDLSEATLQPGVPGAVPGQTVVLNGTGFPANTSLQIGIGPAGSEYEIIDTVEADAGGAFAKQVVVPASAEVMQEYLFVAEVGTEKVISEPFLIVQGKGDQSTPPAATTTPPAGDVNVPVDGQFTRTLMFLVALEDAGQSGQPIGCDDSLVPVVIEIEPTIAPLTAALQQLLAVDSEYYGQSGLYNALYQSDLALQGIDVNNRRARIALTGQLLLGGACDAPRVEAQLEQTALQYSTIDDVQVLINGQPLEQVLSTR